MALYPTPHIDASPSDFAKTVLMPGDPKRSRFIAENYLCSPRLINDVRGIQGYTGSWRGVPVSVMASGMGMPSMSIYAHELYTVFGVENIIRIGSMGGYADSAAVRDIVLALTASTDSNMQNIYRLNGHFAPCVSYPLLCKAILAAKALEIPFKAGAVLSSDSFYTPNLEDAKKWRDLGVIGVEMETAALYMTAAECGKNALSILTVSDHVFGGAALSADERESSLTDMITLALAVAADI
ncbi:MAG: purine-nucleoside phosphorylase [Acutalibacteraceae bacterium]